MWSFAIIINSSDITLTVLLHCYTSMGPDYVTYCISAETRIAIYQMIFITASKTRREIRIEDVNIAYTEKIILLKQIPSL